MITDCYIFFLRIFRNAREKGVRAKIGYSTTCPTTLLRTRRHLLNLRQPDRKSTRLNSSHSIASRMPSSA